MTIDTKNLQEQYEEVEALFIAELKMSLPISEADAIEMFRYIARYLRKDKRGGNGKLKYSAKFLLDHHLPAARVLTWLKNHGAYCDTEVLYNVAYCFKW